MPLFLFHKESNWMLGLWKITETASALIERLPHSAEELRAARRFGSLSRQKEWLATRVLLQELCGEYKEIRYRPDGAPYLADGSHAISISHTRGYAAVMLSSPDRRVGIDIEYPSRRVLKVQDRFLSPQEKNFIDPAHEVNHLLVCWCVKEALYKLLGKEGLQFDRDLELLPFPLQSFGDIEVLSRVTPPGESLLSVRYVVTDDYVIAMACTG